MKSKRIHTLTLISNSMAGLGCLTMLFGEAKLGIQITWIALCTTLILMALQEIFHVLPLREVIEEEPQIEEEQLDTWKA